MKKVLIFSLLLFAVLIMGSGIISAQMNQEIAEIEVSGNENVTEEEILSKMELESGDILEEEQLQEDLQAVFDLGYFQNLQPKFEQNEKGIKMIVEVVENPKLQNVEFEGTKVFEKEQMLEWLGIENDEVINIRQLREGIQKLEREYQEAGYIPTSKYSDGYHYIDFDKVDIGEEGNITIPIEVGRLNEIILEGNEKTKDFVILRELSLEEGDILSMDQIRQDLQSLYRLNYFQEINPEAVEREEDSNLVNLKINFVERKTGTLNFGGGYGTDRGWFGLINLKEENLMGQGQTVGFEWEFGTANQLLALEFYEPRVFGSRTSFGINFHDQTEEREKNDEEYLDKSTGGDITLGHPLNRTWRGSVKFKMEDWEQDFVDSDTKDIDGKTRSITLQGKQDTTNHPFNPTDGSMNSLSWEHGSEHLGGDQTFNKFNYDGRKFVKGFKEDHAWALRLKTGFGSSNLAEANEEYKLGGSQSLRGYEQAEFSGSSMALLNVEYRFPIHDNFTGVVFSDTGNTWDDMNDIDLSELRYSAGLGVRMNTPIGQIRLDYGWNDDGNGRPHFSVGQTF
ncbi:MAG: BamA/OMP85 family outer membrane protein [Halanaerobiaceae bacterium]